MLDHPTRSEANLKPDGPMCVSNPMCSHVVLYIDVREGRTVHVPLSLTLFAENVLRSRNLLRKKGGLSLLPMLLGTPITKSQNENQRMKKIRTCYCKLLSTVLLT